MLQVLAQTGQGGGGGGFSLSPSVLRFLLVALVLGWSGLMWLIRYLREQKKIRDARDREAQRRTETLRTGRDPDTFAAPKLAPRMAPSPQQVGLAEAQRELQERRQQQLRELRKKVAGQQPTPISPRPVARPVPPTARPTTPATVELWPGGPKVVVGQAGLPQPPRQQPVAQQQQRPQKKNRQRAVQQVSSQSTDAPGSIQARGEIRAIRSLDYRSETPTTAIAAGDMPRTAQQWRAAFIASEVLGTPVGLR